MYEYRAKVVNVVDGDTVDVQIDLGFHIVVSQRCRLRGVNCPEVHGASKVAGLAAKDFTAKWVASLADGDVFIKTKKPYADDKYGRFLVEARRAGAGICEGAENHEETLNAALLRTKNAIPFMVDD